MLNSRGGDKRLTDLEKYHLSQARQGSQAAFVALVSSHAPSVYAHLFRMTGSPEDAEDLAQETFLRAFRAIDTFRGESAFRTWVRRIATNVALNHLSKKRVLTTTLEMGEEGSEYTHDIPDHTFSPEAVMHGAQAQEFVENALQTLSPNLRIVFILKELEGYTHEESAKLLGLNPQAVRVRHHRAKKLLAQHLMDMRPLPSEERESLKK